MQCSATGMFARCRPRVITLIYNCPIMPRFIAFLRAINVGGHTVKMDGLRRIFESLGFSSVETFIASGNVIFETRRKNASALERKIASALDNALEYEVATFLRTDEEVVAIAQILRSHPPEPPRSE
jgi:uncharacterized protein (DUF1697 family)